MTRPPGTDLTEPIAICPLTGDEADPGSPIVRIRSVTCGYGDRLAVRDASLTLRAGTITCLVGPSGAGKSTLLAAVVGRHRLRSGTITVDEHPAGSAPAAIRIGYLPQRPNLPARLTGRQVLDLFAGARPGWNAGLAADLAELLGLAQALRRPVREYSPGMARTLHLITTLAHRPALWILDEPLTTCDPLAARITAGLARRLAATGGTILVATTDISATAALADQVAVLCDGRITHAGTLGSLMPAAGTLGDGYRRHTGQEAGAEIAHQVLPTLDLGRSRAPDADRPPRAAWSARRLFRWARWRIRHL